MKYVYDNEGFFLYATPFDVLPKENFTLIEPSENLKKAKFENNQWIEGITLQELADKRQEAEAELRAEYSKKIDELVYEHVQKKIIEGTEIPLEILQQREALKTEFQTKINNL